MTVGDLKKYKDSLYTALSRDLDAFEKNFILLASGILAFSITFIKDIVKIDTAKFIELLFVGWMLVLISVGLMMYAFLASVNGSNKLWKMVDDYMVKHKLFNLDSQLTDKGALGIKEPINNSFFKIKARLRNLRGWAIACFLIGIFSFSSFVGINLYNENQNSKSIQLSNPKKNSITIKTGDIVTTTNDSIITITR